jgi:glycosyltransferase involved in cell wall biosynthesis
MSLLEKCNMKILILSDDFPPISFGGAGIIAYNHAVALSKRGNEVVVITSVQDKKDAGVSTKEGVTIHRLYSSYPERWRAYKSIYNPGIVKNVAVIISEFKPDVVHAHNVHAHLSYASLSVARRHSKALFLTFHDAMSVQYGKVGAHLDQNQKIIVDFLNPFQQFFTFGLRYNPFRNICIKHYLRNVTELFAVSQALKEVLALGGISNVQVLHNGIDTTKWEADNLGLQTFKDTFGLHDKKVLLFAGRLTPAKGGAVVLEVLKRISKSMEDVVLLVAGTTKGWGDSVMEEIRNTHIENKIVFTGWISRENIRYAYASSNLVFVLSQYIDPFPTNTLEAMASKKPVIGTVFGGTPEAVQDGLTGNVVNPYNLEEVTEKTLELLADMEKSESFGISGRKRVEDVFSEKIWIGTMLVWYAKYLK